MKMEENKMLSKALLCYFRKGSSKRKVGVMIAIPVIEENQNNNETQCSTTVKFGYSLCRTSLDNFDRELGKKIAINRALSKKKVCIPSSMIKAFKKFRERCCRYYKQFEVEELFATPNN